MSNGEWQLMLDYDEVLRGESLEEIHEQIELQIGELDVEEEEGWF